MDFSDFGFLDESVIRKEREKARAIRKSQWWKNKLGQCKCYYCGENFKPKELTMDHIVPIARGGRSSKGNIVACCKDCNTKKKTMLPLEWDEYMEKLS